MPNPHENQNEGHIADNNT